MVNKEKTKLIIKYRIIKKGEKEGLERSAEGKKCKRNAVRKKEGSVEGSKNRRKEGKKERAKETKKD